MTSRESIFTKSPTCLMDITEAIEKIEILIARKILSSKLFYDMLLGFRVLEEALQHKQTAAYQLVITWVGLFLKIQSNITNQHDGIRRQFEKVVPSAVTYIIGCLQYKAKVMISYHYQLLKMIHEILLNLRPGVLEKLATFETGVIACVWFPIGFVGDFNTQLLALRLLAMLLKCVDSTRLQSELNSIRCADRSILKDKLTAAIAVANFQTAKFENTARDLLNTYNMHLAKNILVYSFRCKSFKFEDNTKFFKPLNAEHFWIDFNYCPRTLSFNGRCQTNTKAIYINCSVSLQITKLSLNNLTLNVQFQAPAQIHKESGDIRDINQVTTAQIIIPRDEAMRLLENKFILKYFNESQLTNVQNNKTSSFARPLNISTPLSSTEYTEKTIGDKTNITPLYNSTDSTRNNYPNIDNKENISPKKRNERKNEPHIPIKRSKPCLDTQSGTSNKKTSSKQFQKSYEILIGPTKSNNDNSNKMSKVNKTNSEIAKSIDKTNYRLPHLSNLENEFDNEVSKNTRSRSCRRKIVNYSTSASESQLTSQEPKIASKQNVKQQRKRFFKTQLADDTDNEYIPNKTKRMSRPRTNRNTKQKNSNISTKQLKKINEVKPMLYTNQELSKSNAEETITNLPNITNGAALSNLSTNVYEDLTVSDAEPGQSYRNFRIRRNPFSDENANSEVKRSRNAVPRSIKRKGTNLDLSPTKHRLKEALDPFDAAKALPISQPHIQNSKKSVFKNKNQTVYSADIEICSSIPENLADAVVRTCTAYNTETRNEKNVTKSNNIEKNECTTSKMCVEKDLNIDELKKIQICNNLSVPANGVNVNVAQVDDIQDCRQDVSQNGINNICDYDEFSDFPTFSPLIDITNISFSPEYETNKDLAYKRTQPVNIDLALPTTPKSPVKIDKANKLASATSIIYCSRSENDSDSDSEQSIISYNNGEVSTSQPLEAPFKPRQHLFLTPQLPLENFRKTTSVTKCQVTTTGTSVITQQDSFIHQRKFVVNLAASTNAPLNLSKTNSLVTATTTSKTIVEEKNEVNVNSSIQRNRNFNAPTPKALLQESTDMITTYKKNLNLHLDQIETGSNSANVYIEKICNIGESMINEIERERKSLWELEANAERLARQLGWQYEAYQRKHQQFQCFKQNIDDLLRILSNINLSAEIEYDAKHKIEKLQQTSKFITTQEWRNFVNESTENLLKDISSLSNL
ncbi:uncharacterized protein LOC105220942 [Zeugodacus cucurbitae]|uniref:uncharacterized protein LOC105220942 n=1 Tax=Zeugodacus cucurbitae TaxID=28588 RepID=UPI0010A73E23|nr:uncharacterized protein LOC105220942 [Zeugodacus cucurbitae]